MIAITHHIEFDFKDREASDLEKLNRILSAMKLENLELKDHSGYLAVTEDGDGYLMEKRYGMDRGTLICTPSVNGCGYRIDTAVADRSVDYDEFLDIWRASHADRIVRLVISTEFDSDVGYTIVHHQRI